VSARPPRVSVLLPVKDAAPTLPECLASLLGQTLTDLEVVAVDDGSEDGSLACLERAAAGDPRVRVLRTEGAPGLVGALNTAYRAARGPLLARMDADDVAHEERLQLQAQALEGPLHADILGTRVAVLGGTANDGMQAYVAWSNRLSDDAAIRRDLFVESPLVHPSVMMRAAVLYDLGGYRDYEGPEDYDLWLRAAAAGLRFAKLEKTLLLWRDGPGRLTRSDPRYAPDRFRERKVASLLEGPLAGRDAVVWGAGQIGKAWARSLLARGVPVRAFVEVDPRKLGQRIHGAPVVGVAAVPGLGPALHLAAVGQPGARERIRLEARRRAVPDEDLIAVA
jgi:glycosyltransferase involved in cell wall biosynthesis